MSDVQTLISELAYLDHENDTAVADELTEVIMVIREDELTEEEAKELLEDRLDLMKLNHVLETDEHIRLVETIIRQLPGLLFS